MGYIYQADVLCESCGADVCAKLRAEGKAPEDEMETRSYDSDNFPKPASVEREESDSPQHCSNCRKFLHNPLTSDGYKYVQEQLNETGCCKASKLDDVLRDWANWYDFSYWDSQDCAEDGRHTIPGWYSNEAY